MEYERSLTFAAQLWIDSYLAKQTAKAGIRLDRQQTADELLLFLTDDSTLLTPGFVLRRHIQAQGLVSGEGYADLSQTSNIPWPEDVIHQTAKKLSSISRAQHGLTISTGNWEHYLTDAQTIHRDMIFRLAMITGMGREQTLDLLLACGQEPYNMRRPMELICWFCQYTPGVYTWRDVRRLLDACTDRPLAEGGGQTPELYGENFTQLIQQNVGALLDANLPAEEAERMLKELIAQSFGELSGASRTAQNGYLRLTEYLNALYLPGKQATLHKLINAVYERLDWRFEDLLQSPTGKRYVFRGAVEDESASRIEDCVFSAALGETALFCKRYYARANAIENGIRAVDRRDILLLGYFLITGYSGADPDTRAQFWHLTEENTSLDRRIALLRDDLDDLTHSADSREKQVLCCRVLNELLTEFGFRSLYHPAPFDRFILLSLLTDHPARTARYLLGEEMEV